jgi:hypothetical protein
MDVRVRTCRSFVAVSEGTAAGFDLPSSVFKPLDFLASVTAANAGDAEERILAGHNGPGVDDSTAAASDLLSSPVLHVVFGESFDPANGVGDPLGGRFIEGDRSVSH